MTMFQVESPMVYGLQLGTWNLEPKTIPSAASSPAEESVCKAPLSVWRCALSSRFLFKSAESKSTLAPPVGMSTFAVHSIAFTTNFRKFLIAPVAMEMTTRKPETSSSVFAP